MSSTRSPSAAGAQPGRNSLSCREQAMTNGAAAAAAAIARQREEEESMTPYTADDLARYEFKFLRSNTAAFRSREKLEQALAEEAHAGWQLVEKFDSSRLRLKRPITARENDAKLSFDPYRTQFGMKQGTFVA